MATTEKIIKPGYEIDKVFLDKIVDTLLDVAVDPEIEEELKEKILFIIADIYKAFITSEVCYDAE